MKHQPRLRFRRFAKTCAIMTLVLLSAQHLCSILCTQQDARHSCAGLSRRQQPLTRACVPWLKRKFSHNLNTVFLLYLCGQGRCLAGKSGTDSKGPAQRSTAHGPRMAINNIILIFLPFFFFLNVSLQRNGNWK